MAATLRCAGGGQWYATWADAEIGADRNVACGWTGPLGVADTGQTHVEQGTVVHEHRCPECDGRVEAVAP